MSKRISWRAVRRHRLQLLATVSAISLLGSMSEMAQATGTDTDRPPLWIELGWQFERYTGQGDSFAPPFTTSMPRPDFETISPLSTQQMKLYSYGADGKISFQPEGSDWVFSASVRYGRAHGKRGTYVQNTESTQFTVRGQYLTPTGHVYQLVETSSHENHAILDFQASKDVDLGLFGNHGTSNIGFGVRFAQFRSAADAKIRELPHYFYNAYIGPPIAKYLPVALHHAFYGIAHNERSFQGLGPSLSWTGSAPMIGDVQDGEIALDWGASAALLFGRQKASGSHSTADYHRYKYGFSIRTSTAVTVKDHDRSRSVIVPNLGGFAGLSFRYSDAKLSLGYRADFFFGAIDGGIDTRKSTTRGFYGPFASISIGIGD